RHWDRRGRLSRKLVSGRGTWLWRRCGRSATSPRAMIRSARACPALLAFAASACLSSSSVLSTAISVSLVTVDPLAFEGAAVCGVDCFSYRVTLIDVSRGVATADAGVPVTTTALVPCTQPVSFGATLPTPIVVGHFYMATIEGFDRSDITIA